MNQPHPIPKSHDPLLFTPGPLTTSQTVKQAMLRDLGSRDHQFIETVRQVRHQLLATAGLSQQEGYEAVLMQGSGTFAIEATISSVISPQGKLLVIVNGAYGERIVQIAETHGIGTVALRFRENQVLDPEKVDQLLTEDPAITDVAVVHCETTSGIMNPVRAIGQVVQEHGRTYLVDSMSAFGAVPIDFQQAAIDYLISSSNKCIEGVPGFAFVICRREALQATQGRARTVTLDLLAQWQGLEANGQFRFTPPVQVILAFQQALTELQVEGGVPGRAQRYADNHRHLVTGMRRIGFHEYVARENQGPIITSFHYPKHPRFSFEEFYQRLNHKGCVIYPGKVTDADCFRIGNIGRIFLPDIQRLLGAIQETLHEMEIDLSAEVVGNSA